MKKMMLALLATTSLSYIQGVIPIALGPQMMNKITNNTSSNATVIVMLSRTCISQTNESLQQKYTIAPGATNEVWFGGGSFGNCLVNEAESMLVTVENQSITIQKPQGNYTISLPAAGQLKVTKQ